MSEKEPKGFGRRYIEKHNVSVSFTSVSYTYTIVLWGPHIGTYCFRRTPDGPKTDKSYQNIGYRKIRGSHTKYWCSAPLTAVKAIKARGKNPAKKASVLVAVEYNKALERVPQWARTELNRWSSNSTKIVAPILYAIGEDGLEKFQQHRHQFVTLAIYLKNRGRSLSTLRHLCTGRWKVAFRKMFPRLTAHQQNGIRRYIATVDPVCISANPKGRLVTRIAESTYILPLLKWYSKPRANKIRSGDLKIASGQIYSLYYGNDVDMDKAFDVYDRLILTDRDWNLGRSLHLLNLGSMFNSVQRDLNKKYTSYVLRARTKQELRYRLSLKFASPSHYYNLNRRTHRVGELTIGDPVFVLSPGGNEKITTATYLGGHHVLRLRLDDFNVKCQNAWSDALHLMRVLNTEEWGQLVTRNEVELHSTMVQPMNDIEAIAHSLR